jgi:hypothetical protein
MSRPPTLELTLPVSRVQLVLDTGGFRPTYRFLGAPELAWASSPIVLDSDLLLGARQGGEGRRGWSIAWGALPRGRRATAVEVVFTRGRRLRGEQSVRVDATPVGEVMWVAEVAGEFTVVAASAGGVAERRDV